MTPELIPFAQDRPFYNMVATFLASTVGLGPVFDPSNPLALSREVIATYEGRIDPVSIDTDQVRIMAASIGPTTAVVSLCCMLMNTAYESVNIARRQSPEFEFFRHIRNAASHGNRFFFKSNEPKYPAAWRGLIIDYQTKGTNHPLHGRRCFPSFLAPADAIRLLADIEAKLP